MAETPKDGTPDAGKPRFCGKKGRSGPAAGNVNAQRHGMHGCKLPPGCQHIENAVNNLRRLMEAEVVRIKGEISVTDAAAINSILRWERHGLLAAHWLRKEAKTLSASDRLKFSGEIAKAGDARDKNIKLLGLDHDKADNLLDQLYRMPALPAPGKEATHEPA